MVYRSKKDAWLVLVIALGVLVCFGTGVVLLLAGTGSERTAGWVVIGTGVVIGALILWLTNPLYYEITPLELRVRSGPMRWHIPTEVIEEVTPTNNALSSPAMSLDRLRVAYTAQGAGKFVLISPDDKTGFLRELASVAPQLEPSNGGLKSRSR